MEERNNQSNDSRHVPAVYTELATHQMSEDWDGRAAVAVLRKYSKLFIDEFKLDIPEIVLRIDMLSVSQLGHFRGEHNGLGLKCEVAINTKYLNDCRPRWEPFATLAHQLLHAWQFSRGIDRPTWVHDAEFRKKATGIGLVVTTTGLTGCIPDGRFLRLLSANGIIVEPQIIFSDELAENENPAQKQHTVAQSRTRLKGNSKLLKYSCGCTNVRVAQAKFRALCLNCGNEFIYGSAENPRTCESSEPK